jgi:hypothetical protein
MQNRLFKEGGQHDIKHTGNDSYSFSIDLPLDPDGLIGRECPSANCSPAYFKIKLGTGVKGEQSTFYCPYCRNEDNPTEFHTKSQKEYGKKVVEREAHEAISKMIGDSFGLGSSGKKKYDGGLFSIEVTLKQSHLPHVRKPYGEELRRDVACEHCGLEHSVFGIATWCPDCGKDIFLQHVSKEYEVIKMILSDVENRRERLGSRVAARDIENALEDTVSIFEAVLRVITRRKLVLVNSAESDAIMSRIGNKYQNIDFATQAANNVLGITLLSSLTENEIEHLKNIFQKRHPITHNLGVVDRKYLERVQSGELEGREIRVTCDEIVLAIDYCYKIICDTYSKVFEIKEEAK